MIYSFIGKKGSGKSTCSEFFVSKGFIKKSFAQELKEGLSLFTRVPLDFFTDPKKKETVICDKSITERTKSKLIFIIEYEKWITEALNDPVNFIYLKTILDTKESVGEFFTILYFKYTHKTSTKAKVDITPRMIMQIAGTDIVRQFNDSFWIESLMSKLDKNENYVFDDVRFDNEAEAILRFCPDSRFFKVKRPDVGNSSDHHSSEQGISFDAEILLNDGRVYDLHQKLKNLNQ